MHISIRILLVIFSAGLGMLSFPPIGSAWIAAVAWIPLLLALSGVKTSHASYLELVPQFKTQQRVRACAERKKS
jgi:apolipoprotein N-acyltransferase